MVRFLLLSVRAVRSELLGQSASLLASYGPVALRPLNGAFPIQMQSLISSYGGITNLTGGNTNDLQCATQDDTCTLRKQ